MSHQAADGQAPAPPGGLQLGGSSAAEQELLRYAAELNQLRRREREAREEAMVLRRALERAEAQQLKIVADLKRSYEAERTRRGQLQEAYVATIRALATAVEARDDYTGGHIERVRRYSTTLARRLGLEGEALQQVEISAILHDLGKVGVPDAVLSKPDRLNETEWRLMKRHPDLGASIARKVPFLRQVAPVLAAHHEHWDGTGYPRGLRGEAIPLAARIIAVADAFDAMTTDRSYRRAPGTGAALEEIRRCSASHFEPEIAKAFLAGWGAAEVP